MHDTDAPDVEVVILSGEVDLASCARLADRFAKALELGRPVIVDLSDCTFLDVAALEALGAAHREASRLGLGFVTVVPYRAQEIVSRIVFELLPELTRFDVVPTRERALRSLAATRAHEDVGSEQLDAIRARTWSVARRSEELWADRNELVLELRNALAEQRRVRRSAGQPRV